MKLLIIEGPDRCGKNNLIKHLTAQAENYVVRHFGSAKGASDREKRTSQFLAFQREFELAAARHLHEQPDKERYPRDLWIWNRAHLGEFVYGTIYRNTFPEEWVLQMEKKYRMDLDPSVYLLLLEAPPEFLTKRDDGKSFSDKTENRRKELAAFREAFDKSSILNKLSIDVSDGDNYLSDSEIVSRVNKFLNFE